MAQLKITQLSQYSGYPGNGNVILPFIEGGTMYVDNLDGTLNAIYTDARVAGTTPILETVEGQLTTTGSFQYTYYDTRSFLESYLIPVKADLQPNSVDNHIFTLSDFLYNNNIDPTFGSYSRSLTCVVFDYTIFRTGSLSSSPTTELTIKSGRLVMGFPWTSSVGTYPAYVNSSSYMSNSGLVTEGQNISFTGSITIGGSALACRLNLDMGNSNSEYYIIRGLVKLF